MDAELTYKLQLIDCNCNDCKFMERDFDTYKKWEAWHKNIELKDFEAKKAKAIADAEAVEEPKSKSAMLRIANKIQFQFRKQDLLQYGKCRNPLSYKSDQSVCFIPLTCQIETQKCFVHRRKEVNEKTTV